MNKGYSILGITHRNDLGKAAGQIDRLIWEEIFIKEKFSSISF